MSQHEIDLEKLELAYIAAFRKGFHDNKNSKACGVISIVNEQGNTLHQLNYGNYNSILSIHIKSIIQIIENKIDDKTGMYAFLSQLFRNHMFKSAHEELNTLEQMNPFEMEFEYDGDDGDDDDDYDVFDDFETGRSETEE